MSLTEFTSLVGRRSKSSNESPAFFTSLTGLWSGDSSGLVTGLVASDNTSAKTYYSKELPWHLIWFSLSSLLYWRKTCRQQADASFIRTINVAVFVSGTFDLLWWTLTYRMRVKPTQLVLPVKVSKIIDTMLNSDSNFDGHGDGPCKQTHHPLFSDEKKFKQQSDRYITAIVSKGKEKVSIPPSLEACLGIRVRISSHSWRSFCKLAPAPKTIKIWRYLKTYWSTTLV